VGSLFEPAQAFGVIESVKTASDLYSPVGGEVVAVNEQLADRPELVNEDPYGEGWMIRLRVSDPGDAGRLKDASAYRALIEAA
jgi:glycine cleavage system H protein